MASRDTTFVDYPLNHYATLCQLNFFLEKIHDFLNITFSGEKSEGYGLSPEEKEQNLSLLEDMLYGRESISTSQESSSSSSTNFPSHKKRKKRKSQSLPSSQEKSKTHINTENSSSTQQMFSQKHLPNKSKKSLSPSSEQEAGSLPQSPLSLLTSSTTKEEGIKSPHESSPSNEKTEPIIEEETTQEERIRISNLLSHLLKELPSPTEETAFRPYALIYHSVRQAQQQWLSESLPKDQVLGIIEKLQWQIKNVHDAHQFDSNTKFVSRTADSLFRLLMYTPFRYLNCVTMHDIKTLCARLGNINVITDGEGARVKLNSGNLTMGLHVHKKTNGKIDKGAIVDFRNFLNKLGWTTRD